MILSDNKIRPIAKLYKIIMYLFIYLLYAGVKVGRHWAVRSTG